MVDDIVSHVTSDMTIMALGTRTPTATARPSATTPKSAVRNNLDRDVGRRNRSSSSAIARWSGMRQEQKKTILSIRMVEKDKRKPPERDTTDESLRTERRKTDAQLAAHQDSVKEDADAVVARARQMADSVLSDARDREDEQLADEGILGRRLKVLATSAPARMRR